MKERISNLRNIAIIAHVDHGKTTLVDFLLKQSNTFHAKAEELGKDLIMDSNDLEKERGITILAKNTSVNYLPAGQAGKGIKINIIDTPGHADFGGEVERTLNMADGALLLVDAQEGPMPQTKFVLKKALDLNLKIIVVVNKIDKPGANIQRTVDEVINLFLNLSKDETHLDFPTIYAIGREGKAWENEPSVQERSQPGNLEALFKKIIEYIPAPEVDLDAPLQMLVANLDRDNYQGRYTIGRISRGKMKVGQSVVLISADGKKENSRIDKIFTFQGLQKVETLEASAGDIAAVTGIPNSHIGMTVADASLPEPLPSIIIEEPTLRIRIGPNTSPFKGKEGTLFTSRQIAERLEREIETNVGMRLESLGGTDFLVSGRGELHLSILIETLRREGFELEISKPEVIIKEVNGEKTEPYEEVTIDVPEEHVGIITTEFGKRKADLVDLINHNNLPGRQAGGFTRLVYHISTQAFLGLRNILVADTKGTAVINSVLLGYRPLRGTLSRIRNGVLIASETGKAVAFGLEVAQGRGTVFISPTTQVYEGMIIGLNSRKEDIEINVCKGKELTNMRSKGADEAIILAPPLLMTLEQALDFIEDDELLEVTPESIRLRKKHLAKVDRVRVKRSN